MFLCRHPCYYFDPFLPTSLIYLSYTVQKPIQSVSSLKLLLVPKISYLDDPQTRRLKPSKTVFSISITKNIYIQNSFQTSALYGMLFELQNKFVIMLIKTNTPNSLTVKKAVYLNQVLLSVSIKHDSGFEKSLVMGTNRKRVSSFFESLQDL